MKIISFEWKGIEYIFYVGRNSQDNWDLIDGARSSDIWFHLENEPSPHVILEVEEGVRPNTIPRQVIKRGADICKQHSSFKSTANCSIIYTTVDKLIKGRNIGSVNISGDVKRVLL